MGVVTTLFSPLTLQPQAFTEMEVPIAIIAAEVAQNREILRVRDHPRTLERMWLLQEIISSYWKRRWLKEETKRHGTEHKAIQMHKDTITQVKMAWMMEAEEQEEALNSVMYLVQIKLSALQAASQLLRILNRVTKIKISERHLTLLATMTGKGTICKDKTLMRI